MSFGEEGVLLYKFIDNNLFSVIIAKESDPTFLTVYLINGVTGRIVHEFSEENVNYSNYAPLSTFINENFFIFGF